jgi:hypothetical protein
MQAHWEKHGMEALDTVFQKFPDRYVDNYVMLSRIIRLEADVKHSMAKPQTISEALDELEGKVGKDGRKKFEKFLSSMGEELDDEEDIVDVGFQRLAFSFPAAGHNNPCTVLRKGQCGSATDASQRASDQDNGAAHGSQSSKIWSLQRDHEPEAIPGASKCM